MKILLSLAMGLLFTTVLRAQEVKEVKPATVLQAIDCSTTSPMVNYRLTVKVPCHQSVAAKLATNDGANVVFGILLEKPDSIVICQGFAEVTFYVGTAVPVLGEVTILGAPVDLEVISGWEHPKLCE